jgi:hypothetical protein
MSKNVRVPVEKAEKSTYGIAHLVTDTGIEQPKIRIILRTLEIEKNGGRYGWNKVSEYNAVLKQIKDYKSQPSSGRGRPKAEKSEDEAETKPTKEKPAVKAKAPVPTVKAPVPKIVKKNPLKKAA